MIMVSQDNKRRSSTIINRGRGRKGLWNMTAHSTPLWEKSDCYSQTKLECFAISTAFINGILVFLVKIEPIEVFGRQTFAFAHYSQSVGSLGISVACLVLPFIKHQPTHHSRAI